MDKNFPEDIVARLQQFAQEQPHPNTEKDTSFPLAPLHTRLQRLLDTILLNVTEN